MFEIDIGRCENVCFVRKHTIWCIRICQYENILFGKHTLSSIPIGLKEIGQKWAHQISVDERKVVCFWNWLRRDGEIGWCVGWERRKSMATNHTEENDMHVKSKIQIAPPQWIRTTKHQSSPKKLEAIIDLLELEVREGIRSDTKILSHETGAEARQKSSAINLGARETYELVCFSFSWKKIL